MPQFLPGRSYYYNGPITPAELRQHQVELIDLLTVDMTDLAVKELRSVLNQAGEKPFGQNRLLWLKNADQPSEISQNTLLKLAEEPPPWLIIVLQTSNVSQLLPTLRSRLHQVDQIHDTTVTKPAFPDSLPALDTMLRAVKERSDLEKLFFQEIQFLKNKFLTQPSQVISEQLELLSRAIRGLSHNSNQKLVIDYLLLHWLADSGTSR